MNDSDDDVVAVAPPIVSATSRRSGVRRQAAGGRRCRLPHAHGRRREVVSFEPLPSARQQCAESANGRKMEGSRRRSGHWLHSRPCPSQNTTGRWTFLRARRTVRRTGPEVWQGGSKRVRAPPAQCSLTGAGRIWRFFLRWVDAAVAEDTLLRNRGAICGAPARLANNECWLCPDNVSFPYLATSQLPTVETGQ